MRKGKFVLFGLAILSAAAIGGTWAAWTSVIQTGNEYMIPQYKTSLEEKFNPPDDWQPGITTQKQVWVSNNVKDEDGESGVPAVAKVEIHQSWIRRQDIIKKDEAGNDVVVKEAGEELPSTFEDDDKVLQYAAIPHFNADNVCVLSSGKAEAEGLRLGLPYVDSPAQAAGKWLLIDEEPTEIGTYTLYYIGVLAPGEDSPVFLESVTMNPLLENTLTEKHTTYQYATESNSYKQITITNVNSKYGYDGCRYTMDIKATTVQATKDAVDHVFGQGVYDKEVIKHLAENVVDDGVYDHYDLAKTLSIVRDSTGTHLGYIPYRTEEGVEEGNWFMSFTDMLPGGTYLDRLNIENQTHSVRVKIFMRVKPRTQEPIKDELLERITMKVIYKEEGKEDQIVYEGKVTGKQYEGIDLRNLIPLCALKPGRSGRIEVEMHVDPTIELDPETGKCIYADQLSKIDWEFMIQQDNPPGGGGNTPGGGGNPPGRTTTITDSDVPMSELTIPDPEIPLAALARTGDDGATMRFALLAALSLMMLIALGVVWKKEKKQEIQ